MRLLFQLLVCAVIAYAMAAFMAIPANPEVKFWRFVDQQRDREIDEVRLARPGQPIIFFTGGSSCAFSIDPAPVEEACGIPAFNLGLPVAAGPKYLLHQALEKASRGDVLVVCLEPDLLTYPEEFKATPLSFAMASSRGECGAAGGGTSFGQSLTVREYLNLPRPGPGFVATWLGKAITRKAYRYGGSDLRYHGRIETSVTDPALPRAGDKTSTQVLPAAAALLGRFKQAADEKGVRLIYSMPWLLTAEESAMTNRVANRRILNSVSEVIEAVDDGHSGVATDPAYFSDSGLHLSAAGSMIRSKDLAAALAKILKSS